MNFDLNAIFPDLEALTPDGRWSMLQDWLSKNPKYRERAERWSTQSADQVFNEIANLALDEYGALAPFILNTPAIKPKVMRAIEVLQECYQERANNQTEKEIKNVRTKRAVKIGPARRNPKRTDQA